MRLKIGRKSCKHRRCRNKPEKDECENDKKLPRKDDGASRVYKKMGRTAYERYAKDMAQIWWDTPPTVEKSGLFMETSKLRIRCDSRHDRENKVLMDNCPQPHYTLKILKTAYKIYRLRLQKRYLIDKNTKGKPMKFWSQKVRDEEPKWAYILDRPILEQYVLLLQYIRNLGFKLAWKMGHREIISSDTPLRVLEKLHPLKHLDFRGAKHFLPKPFVTASDSETQLRIDAELNRLDRAVAKSTQQKYKEYTIATEMQSEDEVISSSSSSSSSSTSSSSDLQDDEIKAGVSGQRFRHGLSERASKLMEREGVTFVSYRDPESEESLFADFGDLKDYFENYLQNKELLLRSRNQPEQKDRNDDGDDEDEDDEEEEEDDDDDGKTDEEQKEDEKKTKKSSKASYSSKTIQSGPDENDKPGGTNKRGHQQNENGTPDGEEAVPGTSTDANRPSQRKVRFSKESVDTPGPSSKEHDDVGNSFIKEEQDGEMDDDDVPNLYTSVQNYSPIRRTIIDSGICLIAARCQGDYIHNILRRKKGIVNSSLISDVILDDRSLSAEENGQVNTRILETAAGDASASMATGNQILIEHFRQTATVLQNLLRSMSRFLQNTNNLLDSMEASVTRLEVLLPNNNSPHHSWHDIRRHIRIIINRIPPVTI